MAAATEPMTVEEIAADYASLGLTLGRHPLALLRSFLARNKIVKAEELQCLPHGSKARAARMDRLISGDVGYVNLMAGAEATDTLLRGFTTVRDLGGPAFALKRAIDEGLVVGPRIYPSGAMISITGGHGDFRQPYEVPRVIGGPLSRMEQIGGSMIADSPDEVRVRVETLNLDAASFRQLESAHSVDRKSVV